MGGNQTHRDWPRVGSVKIGEEPPYARLTETHRDRSGQLLIPRSKVRILHGPFRTPCVDGAAAGKGERVHLVSEILEGKGREVLEIEADATVLDAVKRMVEANVGSLLVRERGRVVGIVTERDVVNLVAAGGDAQSVTVAQGMTRRHLETIGPKADIGAREQAEQHGITFRRIESLNADADLIDALVAVARRTPIRT